MEENEYKAKIRKTKLKKKQMSTQLKSLVNQDTSLLDASMFESHLKSMDTVCFDVTNSIDELILDLEEAEGENDDKIANLEEFKDTVLTILKDSKHEVILKKTKKMSPTDNQEAVQTKYEDSLNSDEPKSQVRAHTSNRISSSASSAFSSPADSEDRTIQNNCKVSAVPTSSYPATLPQKDTSIAPFPSRQASVTDSLAVSNSSMITQPLSTSGTNKAGGTFSNPGSIRVTNVNNNKKEQLE